MTRLERAIRQKLADAEALLKQGNNGHPVTHELYVEHFVRHRVLTEVVELIDELKGDDDDDEDRRT